MVVIRRGRVEDARELGELGLRSYRDHFCDVWHPAGMDRFLAEQFADSTLTRELDHEDQLRYLLAEVDGRMVGFAKLLFDRPVPTIEEEHGLELQKIYFLREAAGRGLGTAMLNTVLAMAREADEPRVWLDVLRSNDGALRFYERHGFVKRGSIPFATDKLEIGMWVMTRPLP
jgi:ribosomal protein S18 acetylase RimI-like enzyme